MSDRGPHKDGECCFYASGCARALQAREVVDDLRSQLASALERLQKKESELAEASALAAKIDSQLEIYDRDNAQRIAPLRLRAEAAEAERDRLQAALSAAEKYFAQGAIAIAALRGNHA